MYLYMGIWTLRENYYTNPDPREDLKSRSPKFGILATQGYFIGTILRDLLFGSSRGSGKPKYLMIALSFEPSEPPRRQAR